MSYYISLLSLIIIGYCRLRKPVIRVVDNGDVLRIWEKRYKLPKSQRSHEGHRLYSLYDIETVKWLRMRQMEGLSISRAVDFWSQYYSEKKCP